MTPRARYTFFIDSEQREGLREIKEREGIPESEQIRRAVAEWLAKKGVSVKAQSKRGTRKPPQTS